MISRRRRNLVAAVVVVSSAAFLSIAHAGEIYWSSDWYWEPALWRASLDGANTEIVADGTTQAIALDLIDRKLYWGQFLNLGNPYYNVTIQRANLDGSAAETRYDLQTNGVFSLALDRDHGWIFASLWGEDDCVGIKRFEMHEVGDVSDGITIASGHCIYGVAVDPDAGKVYWAEVFPERAIRRAELDGSQIETVIANGLLIYAIDLDTARDKVYWTQEGPDIVGRADLDGSNEEILFTHDYEHSNSKGIALDLRADKVYWTSFSWDMDRLHRADLDGSNAAIAFPISRTQPEIAIAPISPGPDVPAVSVRGVAVLILVLLVVSGVMLRKSRSQSASE